MKSLMRCMLQVTRQATVGDSLCAYAFARVLAYRFGYAFHMPLRGFPGTRQPLLGEQMIGQREVWSGQWPFEAYSGRKVDRREFHEAPDRPLSLQGKFQRWDLISEMRESIHGDWLRFGHPVPERSNGDFVVCLEPALLESCPSKAHSHARSRSWSLERVATAAKSVKELIASVPHRRLFIAVDHAKHPILSYVTHLRPIVVCFQGLEEFAFLHSFQKVAIAQNAAQWWAAFLGRAREIYFPSLATGAWSHPAPAALAHQPEWYGIDLRITDDPRFIYLE
jgi:hypothetical protein